VQGLIGWPKAEYFKFNTMRKEHLLIMLFSFLVISCQKETICEECGIEINPPVANAGVDRVIDLPQDSILLDGSGSKDSDGKIVDWKWELVSGPQSVKVVNKHDARTVAYFYAIGDYLFELSVRDNSGLMAKDTLRVSVNTSPGDLSPQSPPGNLIFYFPDPTSSLDAEKTVTISFAPPLTLVLVKIEKYADGRIDGMWCKACAPRCPVTADYYVEPDNHTSFSLPPGTYTWTAETVFQNFNGYPFANGGPFPKALTDFFAMPHKTGGTVTITPDDTCVVQKIVF
jgi:hypothetical protein